MTKHKVYSCNLTISESGKYARLTTPSGRLIAEIIVDGTLVVAAFNASNNVPEKPGRVNFFTGELIQLERGEKIDAANECVLPAENRETREDKYDTESQVRG